MKFKIQYITRILLVSVVFWGAGCKDFLEENDPSNINPDNFYTIPEHAEAAVNSIYDNLRFLHGETGIFAQNFQLLEMPTGLASTETGQNQDINTLNTLSYNADNLFLSNWWSSLYKGIGNANLALAKIPDIKGMDEAQRARLMGEARFLRAWHYFHLVRLWGDVPLITEPILDASSPDVFANRTPQASVYELIVNDLTAAETSGLEWTDQSGRASLGAVKALLSSVYLTMAGQPLNKGSEYYQLAASKAKEIIDSQAFSLFANYDDLHNATTENTGEHIFMVQYAAGIANAPYQQLLLPNYKDISAYSDEIGTTVPTKDFYNSYEPGDKRVEEMQFYYTQYFTGGDGDLKILGAPYIFKFFDKAAHGTQGNAGSAKSGLNWPLIRYAEVLLTFAEAQNEVTGPTQEVITALKQIRDRAVLVTPSLGTIDQAGLRDLILKERWHELAYEGKTWYDMVRLRKAYDPLTNQFVDFVGYTFSYGAYTLQEKHLLFPLPTREIKNNPNLRPQNSGY